jgi:periplasmic protein TonB
MNTLAIPTGLDAGPAETAAPNPPRPAPVRADAAPGPGLAAPALRRAALQAPAGSERGIGLAVVVTVHVAAAALLASGLARDFVAAAKKPLQMSLIPEQPVKLPPPPPPPLKVEKRLERQPPEAPPPPAYVPPPEVVPVAPAPPPLVVAVQATPPVAPVAIAAPAPAPAPVAPPTPPAPVKREIGLACPGYQAVLAQVLAEAYDRVGVAGAVHTRFTVRGGQVVDVATLSGPPAYFKFVQAAVKRLRCSAAGADEVVVALDVNFAP